MRICASEQGYLWRRPQACAPADYLIRNWKQKPAAWITEVRGPKRVAPWREDQRYSQQAGVPDISGDEMGCLRGGLKLATEVQGTFL